MWGGTKTMYDPCPVGWKVPEIADFGTVSKEDFVYSKGGYTYQNSTPKVFYPIPGCISNADASLQFCGDTGVYMAVDVPAGSPSQRGNLYFSTSQASIRINQFSTTFGFGVRPCQDKAE